MELGLLALSLTIAAFAAQAIVIAIAGAFGRPARDLDFLPLVEFGLLAAATVAAIAAQAAGETGLVDPVLYVDIALLGAFVLLQILRGLAIGRVSRRFRSQPAGLAAPEDGFGREESEDAGEEIAERGSRCVIRRVDPVAIDPKVLEGSSAPSFGIGTYFLYRLSVVTTVAERVVGAQPSVRVVAQATGARIPYLTVLKAGAAFVSALLARAIVPRDLPPELVTFPTLFAAFGIEIESVVPPAADAEATVRCREDENGTCVIVGKPDADGPIEDNEFSSAAAVNVRPVLVGGGVPGQFFPDEIELECKGFAAFKGKLVVEKVTLGGSASVPAGPATLGGTVEVTITPQATQALVTGGGTVGFRCVRGGLFPQ